MITAGVDVGLENIKIAVCDGDRILAHADCRSGGAGRGTAARALYEEALGSAGLSASDVEKVVATGQGKYDVSFADRTMTEPAAAEAYARRFEPDASMLIEAGADQVRVVPLKEGGKYAQQAFNQKCSAGLGTFIRYLAHRFELSLDEMSTLDEDAAKGTVINDGCIVFAELDAFECLAKRIPREQIAAAANVVVGYRLNAILHDKEVPPEGGKVVFLGGLSRNKAVADVLRRRSGAVIVVPDGSYFGCAIGAAIKAAGIE